ncbi:MAG: hypothetical protein ACOYUB_01415 [Patescibacteria group bacterium]
MKKKTIKYLIWIFLCLVSLGFVIYRNGVFSSSLGTSQKIASTYAVMTAVIWGLAKLKIKRSSTSYFLGVLLYASIIAVMFLTGYVFAPTQFVATIALFFYLSKVFKYAFDK